MKTKKTRATQILAFLLAASCLSACGNAEPAKQNSAGSVLAENSQKESTPSAEIPTVTILATPRAQCAPMSDWGMFKDAAASAGVKIEWIEVRTGWDEKKAVTLASGDQPDIYLGTLNSSDVLANLDAFEDMTNLINEYAPNIQAMYEETPETRLSGLYGDGIYSLPLVTAFKPHSYTTLSINQTWLDNLKLEVPATIEEFEKCLIAFRDNDCNGNGDASDEIPFDFPNGRTHDIYALAGAYGAVDCGRDWCFIQDGKVSFLFETDAYYKTTQLAHSWYEQGLITPEVFTNDYTASNALCSQGDVPRVGATTGWSPESRLGKFAQEYVCLPQLSAGDQYQRLWPAGNDGVQVSGDRVVLTKQSKNKEAAIKLVDQFFTPDFSVQSYYGSFDTGITTKYDDGTYSIQCPEGYDSIDSAKWSLSLVDNGCGYYSKALEEKTKAPEELTKRIEQDNINADFWPANTDIWPGLAKFSAENSEELSYLMSDIRSMYEQKMAKWIVTGGIEEEWDAYLSDLQKMGLDKVKGIFQSTYDAYYAGQK